jgi:branched-subunit amino acid aminotransferase/4-amino-4-deoxychorismate lyase
MILAMDERWVFLNGNFSLERLTSISITDRGFLFGEGIFTTIRVEQGRCELFLEHMERLHRQAEILNFYLPPLELAWVQELIQHNQAWENIWRLKIIVTVAQGIAMRTVGNLLATLHPYEDNRFKSSTLCLFPHPLERPLAHVKSLSYLDHLYIRDYAHQLGYDDAITRTSEGILLETGSSNLFWIDQEGCWIPDMQLPYLKGVFLKALLPHVRLPIHFVRATIDQISADASIYICNAMTHIRPVLSINDKIFPRNQQREILLQKATEKAIQF